ncbi:MAG: Gldg family protein [Gammaproteobacteria bacterium]
MELKLKFSKQIPINLICLTGLVFVVLYYGKLNPIKKDLTLHKMHSLQAYTLEKIAAIKIPIQFEIHTNNLDTYIKTKQKLDQILIANPLFKLVKNNPNTIIQSSESLVIAYERFKKVMPLSKPINEEALLNNINQTAFQKEQWIGFVQGHGERNLFEDNERDFSRLIQSIGEHGINFAPISLVQLQTIPQNIKTLILANPKSNPHPKELKLILDYLKNGGNLLWLSDQVPETGWQPLSQFLNLKWLNGNLNNYRYESEYLPHPAIQKLSQLPKHPIFSEENLSNIILPWGQPLSLDGNKNSMGFKISPLFISNPDCFLETASSKKKGPFVLGLSFEKNNQKILVIGNSRFLSNGVIQNQSNLNFGIKAITWLSEAPSLLLKKNSHHSSTYTPSRWELFWLEYMNTAILPLSFLLIVRFYFSRTKLVDILTKPSYNNLTG